MSADADTVLAGRVAALEAGFREIACTRMAGLSLLNPHLGVEAVGFAREATESAVALGVLVTPWFISLLRLPLDAAAAAAMPTVGRKRAHDCGPRRFEFIGAYEAGIGAYEASSLFSPVFEFVDPAAARATAREVMGLLRPAPPQAAAAPARRGFLFGRSALGSPR